MTLTVGADQPRWVRSVPGTPTRRDTRYFLIFRAIGDRNGYFRPLSGRAVVPSVSCVNRLPPRREASPLQARRSMPPSAALCEIPRLTAHSRHGVGFLAAGQFLPRPSEFRALKILHAVPGLPAPSISRQYPNGRQQTGLAGRFRGLPIDGCQGPKASRSAWDGYGLINALSRRTPKDDNHARAYSSMVRVGGPLHGEIAEVIDYPGIAVSTSRTQ
jgi:hypothetical protein